MLNRQLSNRSNTRGTPSCFTLTDPQNPPKTLIFRSKFKLFVCLTVCNHACATLPRTGRSSPCIPRIPSHPPGTLLTQKKHSACASKHMRSAYIFTYSYRGSPFSWHQQPPVWVHVDSFARGEPQPPAGLPSCRATELPRIATGRPPPSRHLPTHQYPQCECAPSDPASTTDADAATNQPPPGYPSPPGHPAPGS